MWFPNTLVNDIKRGMWPELTKRIGDDLMIFLLCESSIFVPLEQGNYLQMTGIPITSKPPPLVPYIQITKRKRDYSSTDKDEDRRKRCRTADGIIHSTVGKTLPSQKPMAQKAGEADCPL